MGPLMVEERWCLVRGNGSIHTIMDEEVKTLAQATKKLDRILNGYAADPQCLSMPKLRLLIAKVVPVPSTEVEFDFKER